MSRISALPGFRFHLMCQVRMLTHLTFAEDFMIFCKWYKQLVYKIMEAINWFTETICLTTNNVKLNMYIERVFVDVKRKPFDIAGFVIGLLPIRNLGLPFP